VDTGSKFGDADRRNDARKATWTLRGVQGNRHLSDDTRTAPVAWPDEPA
jgi:hypothetical protein